MAIATPFGAIYEDVLLDSALGYPAHTKVTIRVNPTKAQWQAWLDGMTVKDNETETEKKAREKGLCSALFHLYSQTNIPGFDFSSPAKAEATWARDDVPDELWGLFLNLPYTIIATRREAVLKNALRSSPPLISIATSPTTTALDTSANPS